MELLVKRDKTYLLPTDGHAEVDANVPEELKKVHVMPLFAVMQAPEKLEDLLIATAHDVKGVEQYLKNRYIPILPALWSGYRSALIRSKDGCLYRVKGVTLNIQNPKIQGRGDDKDIFGGQPRYSAVYEKEMSGVFNAVLLDEGIDQVMDFKGFWHYPIKLGRYGVSASVIKIKGDTRLDEFLYYVEDLLVRKMQNHTLNKRGMQLVEELGELYYDLGFIVGRLQGLMHKNNQTWSAEKERTNAHIGNVVLYREKNFVKVGFVDFDASCDTRDFSESELRDVQAWEWTRVMGSVYHESTMRQWAARSFGALPVYGINKNVLMPLRDHLTEGIGQGRLLEKKRVTNTIDAERFMNIIAGMREPCKISKNKCSPKEQTQWDLSNATQRKKMLSRINTFTQPPKKGTWGYLFREIMSIPRGDITASNFNQRIGPAINALFESTFLEQP